MRAPIEPGGPDWDPDGTAARAAKVGAGLRGAGLLVLLLAFLIYAQQFTGTGDVDPTNPGRAVALFDGDLQPALGELARGAVVEYGTSPALRQKIVDGAAADVFVGLRADVIALVEDDLCTDAAPVATEPAEYAACIVERSGARTAAGTALLDRVTGLDGRDALLQAGFEVPPRG